MIGVFGGTFDPVHYGHLRAAVEVRERLSLDTLRLLPSGTPPHRSRTFASAAHRLNMLRLAVEGHPELVVDEQEIRRGGASYMVDTLAGLRAGAPSTPLLLVIGQDAANGLDRWHDWPRLFELAHLIVMRRPDAAHAYSPALQDVMSARQVARPGDLGDRPYGGVLPIGITQLDISSTNIRRLIAQRQSPAFLAPDAVIEYIDRHGLYREAVE